jgi:SAM-dependent methyltransferase
MAEIKQQVREFYDRVGWRLEGDGIYQNSRYEDLRPVSAEYIHRCHLRVKRFLNPGGRFLLDAGSGPIQYPEYLTYSQGYRYRVCLDISIEALKEARKRIGKLGLFVVADVANLPFKPGVFEGIVSLHTLHHLNLDDQLKAYQELHRTLVPDGAMVVVNGWQDSPLMRRLGWLVKLAEGLKNRLRDNPNREIVLEQRPEMVAKEPKGTFVQKQNAAWLRTHLAGASKIDYQIFCWRSVSVRFLRAVVHKKLGGKLLLRLLFWLEDRSPRWFGENGQYPIVVIRKVRSL